MGLASTYVILSIIRINSNNCSMCIIVARSRRLLAQGNLCLRFSGTLFGKERLKTIPGQGRPKVLCQSVYACKSPPTALFCFVFQDSITRKLLFPTIDSFVSFTVPFSYERLATDSIYKGPLSCMCSDVLSKSACSCEFLWA